MGAGISSEQEVVSVAAYLGPECVWDVRGGAGQGACLGAEVWCAANERSDV